MEQLAAAWYGWLSQLTTGAAALAYVSRGGPGTLHRAAAYMGGRAVMYLAMAGAILLVGWELRAAAIPVITVTRKALGPLMVLVGLGLLGLVRLPGGFGADLASRLQPMPGRSSWAWSARGVGGSG